jgi:DNA-binding transcriptional ArsR family regulator
MSDLDHIFGALGNEHRRHIIERLALQPRSIGELAHERGLSLPAIHRHIKGLEAAGMVIRRKVGRTNFLALDRRPLRVLQAWIGRFRPEWGSESETLENYIKHLSSKGKQ